MEFNQEPLVSIIIPCFDKTKDKYIPRCLDSIYDSHYPSFQLQILIIEGLTAEEAKSEGLRQAKGEYIVFLDTDNEVEKFYLRDSIEHLQNYPEVFGVESTYCPTENSLNTFLTKELHISDPISLLITNEIRYVNKGWHNYCFFDNSTYAYPLGANGFVYRKKDLDRVEAHVDFEDTQIPLRLVKSGAFSWIQIPLGIKHHYVDNLWQFFLKRRRQTFHYLDKKEKGLNKINWTMLRPRQPIWLAFLYCLTIIGPVMTTLFNLRRTKLWLWWTPCCLISALGLVAGVTTFYFSKFLSIQETSLQPKRI